MIANRAMLDVPRALAQYLSRLLNAERLEPVPAATAEPCPASGRLYSACAGSARTGTYPRWRVTVASPAQPDTATWTRSSRCSPAKPRTCTTPALGSACTHRSNNPPATRCWTRTTAPTTPCSADCAAWANAHSHSSSAVGAPSATSPPAPARSAPSSTPALVLTHFEHGRLSSKLVRSPQCMGVHLPPRPAPVRRATRPQARPSTGRRHHLSPDGPARRVCRC